LLATLEAIELLLIYMTFLHECSVCPAAHYARPRPCGLPPFIPQGAGKELPKARLVSA